MSDTKEPIQLERIRDFVRMVTEWTAKFPLKGDGSVEDCAAATEIYCCCEGAEENIYELRQLYDAGLAAGASGQADAWMEFIVKHMCSLCGQSGVIDTRGIRTPANFECGGLHYCICPNGRALKTGNAPKEQWLNQAQAQALRSSQASEPLKEDK